MNVEQEQTERLINMKKMKAAGLGMISVEAWKDPAEED